MTFPSSYSSVVFKRFCSLRSSVRYVSYLERIFRRKNYYQILGVPRSATPEEIKKAFVRKANELHPDRNGFATASTAESSAERIGWNRKSRTEMFMDVKEAYDVLRNPTKKKEYDSLSLANSDGFLMEVSPAKSKTPTVIELNRARNSAYSSGTTNNYGGHFVNPEEVFEKERKKNRFLVSLGVLLAVLILSNIGYVSYAQRNKSDRPVI